jgi:hypothetical protein
MTLVTTRQNPKTFLDLMSRLNLWPITNSISLLNLSYCTRGVQDQQDRGVNPGQVAAAGVKPMVMEQIGIATKMVYVTQL